MENGRRTEIGAHMLGHTLQNARIHSYELHTLQKGQTNDKYKLVREFAKLARNHYSTSLKAQTTQGIRKAIKNIAPYLCDGDQHDSHELMVLVTPSCDS